MTKQLVDIDDNSLAAGQDALGILRSTETVNAARTRVGPDGSREVIAESAAEAEGRRPRICSGPATCWNISAIQQVIAKAWQ
jgi:Arc/MetJ family transcription regulator